MSIGKSKTESHIWDQILMMNEKIIRKSPIYKDKLRIVTNYLCDKSGRLLDLGFGYGYLEDCLTKFPKLKLYGIDFSSKFVDKVSRRIKGCFVKGHLCNLPFNKSFFEYVVMLDTIEHLTPENVDHIYDEILRVLKPGGKLIISVPLNESKSDYLLNKHKRRYSLEILISELKKKRFKIDKYKQLTAFQKNYSIKKIVNFLMKRARPNLLIVFCTKE